MTRSWPIPPGDATRHHGKLVLALLGSLGFAFPLLAMLRYRASPFFLANESLAYRFMLSERILGGAGATAWDWNGHLASAIQTSLLALIDHFSGLAPADLEQRTSLYSYLYLGLVTAAGVSVLFIAARRRAVTVPGMALLAIGAGGPVFLTRVIGFHYFTRPDYYVLDLLLTLVALLLFQCWWTQEAGEGRCRGGWVEPATAGFFLGLAASNKVTMVVVGAMPLVALLLRAPLRLRSLVAIALVATVAALAAFGFVLLWLYQFDAHAATTVGELLFTSLQNPGAEANFWQVTFRAELVDYSYGVLLTFFVISLFVASIPRWRRMRSRRSHYFMLGALAGGGLAWDYILHRRPAGTTFFEGATACLTLGAMALSTLSSARLVSRLVLGIFGVTVLAAALTFRPRAQELMDGLRDSATRSSDLWRMHRAMVSFAGGHPIIAIIPTDDYTYNGVAEFLLKGAADFPGWTVTARGQPFVDRYVPGMTFRNAYGGTSPDAPYPAGAVVFWVDASWRRPIASGYRRLQALERDGSLAHAEWTVPMNGDRKLVAHAVQTSGGP